MTRDFEESKKEKEEIGEEKEYIETEITLSLLNQKLNWIIKQLTEIMKKTDGK